MYVTGYYTFGQTFCLFWQKHYAYEYATNANSSMLKISKNKLSAINPAQSDANYLPVPLWFQEQYNAGHLLSPLDNPI